MTLPRSGTGLTWFAIEGASSSGTESYRQRLDSPLGIFGVCVTMATCHNGLTSAALYGSVSNSTTVTTAQADTLITWSSSQVSGANLYSSTSALRTPINQIWAVVLDAATSETSDVDVWVSALP